MIRKLMLVLVVPVVGLLGWWVVFLVASTWVGLWVTKYIKNMEDYVVAGRGVKTYLGVATIIASEMGLVTVMYSAQMGFTSGLASFAIALLAAVAAFTVGVTGFIVLPFRRTGAMTIPEFYEMRYGRGVRLMGGIILAASGILNMGMFLKVDSMFVTSVMGMNSDLQLKIAMSVMLGLVLLYTMLGGMISVLFTDYIQYVVMAVALVATSILLMGHFSWGDIVQGVTATRGDAGFNPLMTGTNLGIGYLVWMFFLGFVSAAVWQTAVIRAASAEDDKVVKKTYTLGAIGFLIRFLIPYFWGVCALVYVAGRPELRAIFLPEGGASSELQLRAMPVAIGALVPSGAIGILTAGMLAAAMSTYNTYMHAWSAVITQDVIGPLTGQRLSSRTRIMLTRIIMTLIAVFLLVWGLWYPLSERLWDYMAITGAVYFTGAFAVLVGGLYWRRTSKVGAYGAFVCGFLMLGALKPVQEMLGIDIKGQYMGLAVAALAMIVMILLSLLFPNKDKV